MFIVSLTYICDLKNVETHLQSHIDYLDKQYDDGVFLASGRKVPRTGGIILAKAESINELSKLLDQDPFKIHNIAKYEIIEFIPTKTSHGFEFIKES